jgi:hypothetical protein
MFMAVQANILSLETRTLVVIQQINEYLPQYVKSYELNMGEE